MFGDEIGAETEEHSIPLSGIDVEMKGEGAPAIEIMLGGEKQDSSHLTHAISNVQQIVVKVGDDGSEEILEIESQETVKTLLHLEPMQKIGKSN